MLFVYIVICLIWLFIFYKTSQDNSEIENDFFSKMGIAVLFLAIASPFIVFEINSFIYKNEDDSILEKLGATGDFLGGSTVGLLTLASIMFIISTLKSQRESLSYQKEELILSREEFEKLNDEMRIQQFERSFFTLLSLYKQSIDELILDNYICIEGANFKGLSCIDRRYEQYNHVYQNYNVNRYLRSLLFRYDRESVLEAVLEINEYLQKSKLLNTTIYDSPVSINSSIPELERQKEILKLFENEISNECFGAEGVFDINVLGYLCLLNEQGDIELKENIIINNFKRNNLPYNHAETAFHIETEHKFDFMPVVNNLVNLLEYIEYSDLYNCSDQNKQFYKNIIQAQVSNSLAKYLYIYEFLLKTVKLINSKTDFLYTNIEHDILTSQIAEADENKNYYLITHKL